LQITFTADNTEW